MGAREKVARIHFVSRLPLTPHYKSPMQDQNLLNKALAIAVEAHADQLDKVGAYYLRHVFRVVERCNSYDAKVVAALHDVLEDHGDRYSMESLAEDFPEHILAALACVTKTHEDEPYDEFIERLLPNPIAREVKLADLEDNLDVRRLSSVDERGAKRITKYLAARERILKSSK